MDIFSLSLFIFSLVMVVDYIFLLRMNWSFWYKNHNGVQFNLKMGKHSICGLNEIKEKNKLNENLGKKLNSFFF